MLLLLLLLLLIGQCDCVVVEGHGPIKTSIITTAIIDLLSGITKRHYFRGEDLALHSSVFKNATHENSNIWRQWPIFGFG